MPRCRRGSGPENGRHLGVVETTGPGWTDQYVSETEQSDKDLGLLRETGLYIVHRRGRRQTSPVL